MTAPLLLLDVGNTRVKWALVQPGLSRPDWLAEGVCTHAQMTTLASAWNALPAPGRVFGANVAGLQAVAGIADYWQQRGVMLSWAQTQSRCCGVSNTYDEPAQLGVDRWAALIGAWHSSACAALVVSAGTAMTLDILDHQGIFQGGMILPGRTLMHTSLAHGTHSLNVAVGNRLAYPRNTADAMASGISMALVAAIQETYARLSQASTPPPVCLLTGGDAEWLAEQLEFRCTIAPKLVLEGLLQMVLEETGG